MGESNPSLWTDTTQAPRVNFGVAVGAGCLVGSPVQEKRFEDWMCCWAGRQLAFSSVLMHRKGAGRRQGSDQSWQYRRSACKGNGSSWRWEEHCRVDGSGVTILARTSSAHAGIRTGITGRPSLRVPGVRQAQFALTGLPSSLTWLTAITYQRDRARHAPMLRQNP